MGPGPKGEKTPLLTKNSLWRNGGDSAQTTKLGWMANTLLIVVATDVAVMLSQLPLISLTWFLDSALPQWRYEQLPILLTLLKAIVLSVAVCTQWAVVLGLVVIVAIIAVLANDAFRLDSLDQTDIVSQGLQRANLFNILPYMFSVFEGVLLIQVFLKQRRRAEELRQAQAKLNDLEEASQSVTSDPDATAATSSTPTKGISFMKMLMVLRPYFWPHGFNNRIRAFSTYCFLVAAKVLNLYSPLFMANSTNALVARDYSAALRNVVFYCAANLTVKGLGELQSVVYLKVKQTAYVEIATMTYEHLHSLSLDWHLKKKLGDVLRSMDRGVESANSVVSYMFLYLLPTVLEAAVVMIIFATHFELASLSFVAFSSLVIYAHVTIILTLWRKKFRQQSTKHDNEYHDKATDALINYETIKYFTNERHEIDSYSSSIHKYQSYSVAVSASLSVLNVAQSTIIQGTILSCLALAIPHVIQDTGRGVDLGSFIAISVYLNNIFSPLSFLGSLYNMMINAIVDMQKLSELLNVDPDIMDAPNAPKLLLDYDAYRNGISVEFQDVSFDYPDNREGSGLKNVSFVIPAGTTTALVGETGSGKTTISRLLFRFYDVKSGHILINNQDVSAVTQLSLRKAIGIVPQDTVLFNQTVLYNIQYGNMESSFEQVVDAAKKAKIYDFIMQLPLKWDTMVGERGLKLSGGEKQRVAIARTLLKNPPFVILDEATSALDTVTESEIQQALTRLQTNRTMLVIAHRLSTIRNASQIVVLGKGSVLEMGAHDDLMQANGKYASMWNAQLESQKELEAGVHLTSEDDETTG
ncbi:Aste57867_9356 [Aphanomyces stellatus]|uniref:Aste57867_9356 protein n=1 Tax=Aphanomyces stellatus TaxID=120398 RepID=A0A485KMN8_9STRA|nr:hypothetical protein As57867_009320 [Aphanomyces stellatus]VFT86237.1 Aste57867_9356 [Aphanomyces stellatus]